MFTTYLLSPLGLEQTKCVLLAVDIDVIYFQCRSEYKLIVLTASIRWHKISSSEAV